MGVFRRLSFLIGAALCGCVNVSPAGTFFSSEPSGARVWVDGRDSGWVTPCLIDLENDERHQVRIELAGYAPREVALEPRLRREFISWDYGINSTNKHGRLPIFLPTPDLLLPLRDDHALAPSRVFVRLRPAGTD